RLRIGYFKAKTVLPSVLAVEAMRREITDVPYLLQWPRYQFAIITDPAESRRVATLWRHTHRSSQWPEGGVFVQTARAPRDRYNPLDFTRQILAAVQQAAAGNKERASLGFVNRWGRLGVGIPGDPYASWDGVALTHERLRQVRDWIEAYAALSKGKATAATWPSLGDFLNSDEMLAGVHHEAADTERGLVPRFRV